MSLCRHYVRELRRSVLLETPEPEKIDSRPSSSYSHQRVNGIGDENDGPSGYGIADDGTGYHDDSDQRLSAFLRSEGHTSAHSMRSGVSDQSGRMFSPVDRPRRVSTGFNSAAHGNGNESGSPGHTVARSDIRASALRVLYTYLLPGSEREVVLPDSIVEDIVHMVEEEGRDDPEVFDTAKDYVFQAMERDAFPGFLQAKALGNLVPPSILARLIIALTSFGGAFWAAFYVILTDASRTTRCWVSSNLIFPRHSFIQCLIFECNIDSNFIICRLYCRLWLRPTSFRHTSIRWIPCLL